MDSRGFIRLRQPEILFAGVAPRGSFRRKGGGGNFVPRNDATFRTRLLISLKRGGRIFGEKPRKQHEHGMGRCHLSASCGGHSSRSPLRGWPREF